MTEAPRGHPSPASPDLVPLRPPCPGPGREGRPHGTGHSAPPPAPPPQHVTAGCGNRSSGAACLMGRQAWGLCGQWPMSPATRAPQDLVPEPLSGPGTQGPKRQKWRPAIRCRPSLSASSEGTRAHGGEGVVLKALHSARGLCLSEEGEPPDGASQSPEEALPPPPGMSVQGVSWCPRVSTGATWLRGAGDPMKGMWSGLQTGARAWGHWLGLCGVSIA